MAESASDKLLARAPAILEQIDKAYIVTHRGHRVKPMPTFEPEELSLGKFLGSGGFSIVHEISGICLNQPEVDNDDPAAPAANHTTANGATEDPATATTVRLPPSTPSVRFDGVDKEEENEIDDSSHHQKAPPSSSSASAQNNLDPASSSPPVVDLNETRRLMEKRAVRNGQGRYAIKRLHGKLNALEKARGRLDLAVEAKYLAVVSHPNIIKLRGIAAGSSIDPGFFLLLDRLYGTLDQKINDWFKIQKQSSGGVLGLGKKPKQLKQLLIDRMTVAYDLAAAFFYLHENRIVYRDIKPENIGFDVRGDVKIFDFGLCKSLSSDLKAPSGGYGYRLTGRAGSLPYMAPEVIRMETYDTKCDVYSFAVLLWEILCLKQAFKGLTPTEFVERVVTKRERMTVPKTLPSLVRLLLPEAWDDQPMRRPDMKRVAILIRGDLNDLTHDDQVLNRTNHMDDRSVDSLRGGGE